MKPFLKWAGGKYRLLNRIQPLLPEGARLIEPFVGGGAVFLNSTYKETIINDINADIYDVYAFLKSQPLELIEEIKNLFMLQNNEKEKFLAFRKAFNEAPSSLYKSALFIYLNRHCFNGLCRYNSKGGFNVPFGRYAKPYFPQEELLFASKKLENMQIFNTDFRDIFSKVEAGDVVYCDPPYIPLSETASFTAYHETGFSLKDQQDLVKSALEASIKGAHVVISNHDTPFSRQLYKEAECSSFLVQRMISSDFNNRKKEAELLAVFSPKIAFEKAA